MSMETMPRTVLVVKKEYGSHRDIQDAFEELVHLLTVVKKFVVVVEDCVDSDVPEVINMSDLRKHLNQSYLLARLNMSLIAPGLTTMQAFHDSYVNFWAGLFLS